LFGVAPPELGLLMMLSATNIPLRWSLVFSGGALFQRFRCSGARYRGFVALLLTCQSFLFLNIDIKQLIVTIQSFTMKAAYSK
jgi:hypothetical protein